jgi:hypothetical protein
MNKMFLFSAVAVGLLTGKLQGQSLPGGLISKCECPTERAGSVSSFFSNVEFVTPQGLYHSVAVAEVVQITVDSSLRISQQGIVKLFLPIVKREMYGPQFKLIFPDGGYALLTPSIHKDRWTMVRLYKAPNWESSTGSLYLAYY